MISFLRRHQKSIFAATLTIFFGGMFVGFGGYWFEKRDLQGVVARVGSVKIEEQTLLTQVEAYEDQARSQGKEPTEAEIAQYKQQLLQAMIVDEMLAQKADQLDLVVSDEQLAREIRGVPAFRRDGQFDQDTYIALIRERFRMTPQEFEEQQRKALKAALLKNLILRTAKVPATELAAAYAGANKGSMKDFDKYKDAVLGQLQQQRALGLLNNLLQKMQTEIEVQNLLQARPS
jgi:peptidyl-prolyl cis-trans isomerase D